MFRGKGGESQRKEGKQTNAWKYSLIKIKMSREKSPKIFKVFRSFEIGHGQKQFGDFLKIFRYEK